MTLFDSPAFEGHEGVHAFYRRSNRPEDASSPSTPPPAARRPAAAACGPIPRAEAALEDALRLSRAMSYKNAMADLELGGGKAVIIGDSRTMKTPGPVRGLRPRGRGRGRPVLDRRGRGRLARRPDARAQAPPAMWPAWTAMRRPRAIRAR